MRQLVLQSWRSQHEPDWIAVCMRTVQCWADRQAADYRFVGDELLERVPRWYLDKIAGRMPIAADLGRLRLCQEALEEGYDQVVWFDADTIILCDQGLSHFAGDCAFGQEYWVQRENGRLRVRRNVHNAFCVFRRGSVTLPFLAQTVESIIRRADEAYISPQMVGPKLLGALQPIAGFDVLPAFGALSPEVLDDIDCGGGLALSALRSALGATPLIGANVCASLSDNTALDYRRLVEDAIPRMLGEKPTP